MKQILSYARPEHRRWAARTLALCTLIMIVWTSQFWTRKYLLPWVEYEIRWNESLNNRPPMNCIIYDEDPWSAEELLQENRDYRALMPRMFNFPPAGLAPPDFRPPCSLMIPGFQTSNTFLDSQVIGGSFGRYIGTDKTFLIEIRYDACSWAPDGHRVVISAVPLARGSYKTGPEVLDWTSIWLEIRRSKVKALALDSADIGQPRKEIYSSERLRLFAPQIDKDHGDHFTIRFSVDDYAGFIDGWLRSAGSTDHYSSQKHPREFVDLIPHDGSHLVKDKAFEDPNLLDDPYFYFELGVSKRDVAQ